MTLKSIKKYKLSVICFVIVLVLLGIVHLKTNNQIIIIERFIKGFAYLEIFVIAFYAAFLIHKMKDPKNVPLWRQRSWFLFSMVFFGQLLLGLVGFEKFLMTGNLHLPVPAMIMSGPIFRGEASFMTILFLSTVILSGPTWCSHLCYFGAVDGMLAKGKTSKRPIKTKFRYKHSILILVIAVTILLRFLNIDIFYASIFGAGFGITGLLIIIFLSKRKRKMIHCAVYCPIGTLISYAKYVNPFRIRIQDNCTMCAHCIPSCKYDALNIMDLKNKKPGNTCTLCGDCLASCSVNSIQYRFLGLSAEKARNLYLIISISLHAVFLALAKI
jgi:ferredoxin-type protein NapH